MPGAHKIGAAISGPRIANNYEHEAFSELGNPGKIKVSTSTLAAPLLENGVDRPENFYGRHSFACFSSISISTTGVDGARASL